MMTMPLDQFLAEIDRRIEESRERGMPWAYIDMLADAKAAARRLEQLKEAQGENYNRGTR